MPDQIATDVYVSLVTGAIAGFAQQTWKEESQHEAMARAVRFKRLDSEELNAAIGLVVADMRAVERADMRVGGAGLLKFLNSPDCIGILGSAFAFSWFGSGDSLSEAREAFVETGMLWAEDAEAVERESIGQVFDAACKNISYALEAAAARGATSAKSVRDNFIEARLSAKLDEVEKRLALLRGQDPPSAREIDDFESLFRKQTADREGKVLPPSVHGHERIPIDDIYVAPDLKSNGPEEAEELEYTKLLANLDRAVVVGDPGGGKSTLTQKICFDVSTGACGDSGPVSVFRVVLRDLQAERTSGSCSIFEFLTRLPALRYNLVQPRAQLVEYLLRSGRCAIMFDGLDELLDTAKRRDLVAEVESFANLFPAAPILVTSRKVGYEEASLTSSVFAGYELGEFSDEQIEAYAAKWFGLDDALTSVERKRLVGRFLSQSAAVQDLRTNPLLLGLMCSLYKNDGFIPANRPDVYRSCAELLFLDWDRKRGIGAPSPFESQIRPAMQWIANWMYSDPSTSGGVTLDVLIAKTTEYFLEHRFDAPEQAIDAAREFVDLTKGRAWVFSEAGSTVAGTPLYQFTHRTFLEYFTAEHIAANSETVSDFVDYALPRLVETESDVMLQLALDVKSRTSMVFRDTICAALLDRASTLDLASRLKIHGFLHRVLQFLVPKPVAVREVIGVSLDLVREAVRSAPMDGFTDPIPNESTTALERRLAERVVGEMFLAGPETVEVAQAELVRWLSVALESEGSEAAVTDLVLFRGSRTSPSGDSDSWLLALRTFADDHPEHLGRAADALPSAAVRLFYAGYIDFEHLLARWGLTGAFARGYFALEPNTFQLSVSETMTHQLLENGAETSDIKIAAKYLRQLAPYLRTTAPPWPVDQHRMIPHETDGAATTVVDWDDDLRFAVFCMWAVTEEFSESDFVEDLSGTPDGPKPIAIQIKELVSRRGRQRQEWEQITRSIFTIDEDRKMIEEWLGGALDLTVPIEIKI